jgi:hypothetical protein
VATKNPPAALKICAMPEIGIGHSHIEYIGMKWPFALGKYLGSMKFIKGEGCF